MPLILGSVTFTDDEAPEQLPLGGEQALAIRDYPGGQRDIQVLGAFDDPIAWDGCLWFETALDRMAALDAIRIAGEPVTLQQGNLSVQVVVKTFKPLYLNDFRIPYHIEVVPTAVMSMQPGGGQQLPGPTVALGGDLGGLLGSSSSATDVLGQLAMTPTALANPASVPPAYVTNNEFASSVLAPVGAIINEMSPPMAAAVQNLTSQVTHLVEAGETLWSIASTYYTTPGAWAQIAAANNIQNPVGLTPGTLLQIPNPTRPPRQTR